MTIVRTRVFLFAALFVFGLPGAGVRAGGPGPGGYLTNVEMMQLVARGALAEALRDFPGSGGEEPLRVLGTESGEADWIVENEVVAALGMKGARVLVGEFTRPRPRALAAEKKGTASAPPMDLSFPIDIPPSLLSGPGVPYPAEACASGLEGNVVVRAIVNEQGSVANVIVDESSGEPFESAVQKALESYRYRPGQRGGSAAPSLVRLRFRFPVVQDGCEKAVAKGEEPGAEEESQEKEVTEGGPPAEQAGGVAPGIYPTDRNKVLNFRVSEMEMRYPHVGRRLWFGPKRVERYARMRVDLRLKQGGQVLWAGSAEHYASDRVPFGSLPYLENSEYAFASPEIAPGAKGRVLEPFIVAGMIGGLVLLFYANQTGN